MRIKTAVGIGTLATALALSGCSGGKHKGSTPGGGSAGGAGAALPNGATSLVHGAPVGAPPTTSQQLSEGSLPSSGAKPAGSSTAKPVSALLAGVAGPITTKNAPKAKSEWIALVQTTDDTGKAMGTKAGMSVNLAALVDEAAKTSDTDALLKLCNLCDQAALKQKLAATDAKGRTGYQLLSLILEKTHAAPAKLVAEGWDYPGFSVSGKTTKTRLDQQDMTLLGTTYNGIRAQFAILDDGPSPYVGWTGMGAPNT